MAFIKSFIKRKKQACNLASEKITVDTLKQLIPIRTLSEEKLQSFALNNSSEVYAAGETLFNINDPVDSALYLLKGAVTLSDANGKNFDIEAPGVKAKFPLTSGVKNTTTAIAKTDISILRVSQKIMAINSSSLQPQEINIPEEFSNNRLLQGFAHHFIDDDIEVPVLPVVAIKLRQAMQKDIGIKEAVEIIQLDPVISAKLIEVANCPLYISVNPVKSCFEAVNRIGLNATRSLVIGLSLNKIFTCTSIHIKKHLDKLWKNSLHLSFLCRELASVSKQSNPEEALLAGLVCDIGTIPFLNYVSKLPDKYYNDKDIREAIPVVKGIVGAYILKKWDFADEFIQVPLSADNWFQSSGETLTYTDIVVLSKLHSKIGNKDQTDLPLITSIPAASKLKNITLSTENSLSILYDAEQKINETLNVFLP